MHKRAALRILNNMGGQLSQYLIIGGGHILDSRGHVKKQTAQSLHLSDNFFPDFKTHIQFPNTLPSSLNTCVFDWKTLNSDSKHNPDTTFPWPPLNVPNATSQSTS